LHFNSETDKGCGTRVEPMRQALVLGVLIVTAASPAAAQSCATLSGQLDCRGAAPAKQPPTSPRPSLPGQDADVQGNAETTISNRGMSTTLDNKVIDSHGVVEFGFSGSKGSCRRPGSGALCD
jgi:hypothetical protein